MKVRVRASDLAALAGRHDFRTQEDAVREVWAGATGGRRKEKEVKAERVLRDVPAEVRTEVAQLLHVPDAPAAIVQALDARSLHVAKGDAVPDLHLPREMAPVVDQHMRMAVGTVEEDAVLDHAKAHFPDDVPAHALYEPGLRRLALGKTDDGNEVELVGVCDAKSDVAVYEIKRRKNKLFGAIPMYERVQLEAYLRLYDRYDGALIEYHPTVGMALHWVERDDQLWESVEVEVLEALTQP